VKSVTGGACEVQLAVNFLNTWIAIFVFSWSLISSAVVSCPKAYQYPLSKVENLNAQRTADDYKQTNQRDKYDYAQRLLQMFKWALGRLGPDDIYVDQGSGQGLAATQISIDTGAKTIAINPQDYSYIIPTLIELTNHLHQAFSLNFAKVGKDRVLVGIETKSGIEIPSKLLKFAYEIVGRRPPRYFSPKYDVEIPPEKTIKEDLKKILQAASEELKKANVIFEVGLGEEVLRKYENQVTLISDVYAAFFYSPDRLQVLEVNFKALKPGGEAYYYLGDGLVKRDVKHDEYEGDVVKMKKSHDMTLPRFLERKFPTIFSLKFDDLTGAAVLVMKKTQESLNLSDYLEVIAEDYYIQKDNGYAVPKLTLREK
jgi:hypothetical protein